MAGRALRPELWGGTLIFEVSSSGLNEEPNWVNLSDRVLVSSTYPLAGVYGQQSLADPAKLSAENGRGGVVLRNDDYALTPGSPGSQYPWFRGSRRARLREAYGVRIFTLFDGIIEIPAQLDNTAPVDGTARDVLVALAVTDRIAREANGRTMISTLGEYIVNAGGAANGSGGLVSLWPLLEPDGSLLFTDVVGSSLLRPHTVDSTGFGGSGTVDFATAYLNGGGAPVMFGDDAAPMLFSGDLDTLGLMTKFVALTGSLATSFTCNTVATVSGWVYPDDSRGLLNADPIFKLFQVGGGGGCGMWLQQSPGTATHYEAEFFQPVGSLFVDIPALVPRQWSYVALRMSFPSGLCEVWINDTVGFTGTVGSPAASGVFGNIIELGWGYNGGLGYFQSYNGGYTFPMHLAQFTAGRRGWKNKRTGKVVNAIADYAGIPAGARDIDPGVAIVGPVSLAGKNAAAAWESIRETEQGRLFMSPDGRLTFHDRRRVYNV